MEKRCSLVSISAKGVLTLFVFHSALVLQGQTKTTASGATGTAGVLLVDTDDSCRLVLDGKDEGVVKPDQANKISVSLGEHILKCTVEGIPDLVWRKVIEVKNSEQIAALISLKALHIQYQDAVAKLEKNKPTTGNLSVSQNAAAPPEVQRLGVFVGEWAVALEGKGSGRKASGTESCEWISGGFGVLCRYGVSKMSFVYLTFYNAQEKKYVSFQITDTGEILIGRGTTNGDTWTWIIESTWNSKTTQLRLTRKWTSPDSYGFKYEAGPTADSMTVISDGKETRVTAQAANKTTTPTGGLSVPQNSEPSPEVKRLGAFVGEWTRVGDFKASSLGSGGQMTGTESCEWISSGFGLLCKSSDTLPRGKATDVSMTSYDAQAKNFVSFEVDSTGGTFIARGTANGKTWTWTSEATWNGKTIQLRVTEEWTSPDSYDVKAEAGPTADSMTVISDGKETRVTAPSRGTVSSRQNGGAEIGAQIGAEIGARKGREIANGAALRDSAEQNSNETARDSSPRMTATSGSANLVGTSWACEIAWQVSRPGEQSSAPTKHLLTLKEEGQFSLDPILADGRVHPEIPFTGAGRMDVMSNARWQQSGSSLSFVLDNFSPPVKFLGQLVAADTLAFRVINAEPGNYPVSGAFNCARWQSGTETAGEGTRHWRLVNPKQNGNPIFLEARGSGRSNSDEFANQTPVTTQTLQPGESLVLSCDSWFSLDIKWNPSSAPRNDVDSLYERLSCYEENYVWTKANNLREYDFPKP